VFDDSFEHEAWNEGAGERIVLIVDIWHPDLTPSERWALDRVVRVSPRARAYARSARR
jgi:aspartate beta-hydroxylase